MEIKPKELTFKKKKARLTLLRNKFGDIFHFPDNTPEYVINSLFSKDYRYPQRFNLVMFFWTNGISLPLFLELIKGLEKLSVTELIGSRTKQMIQLWKDIDAQKYPR